MQTELEALQQRRIQLIPGSPPPRHNRGPRPGERSRGAMKSRKHGPAPPVVRGPLATLRLTFCCRRRSDLFTPAVSASPDPPVVCGPLEDKNAIWFTDGIASITHMC